MATDTRTRYIPKAHTVRGRTVWGVYDRVVGSFPHRRPGVGVVAQDHTTEHDAQTEADRLEREQR